LRRAAETKKNSYDLAGVFKGERKFYNKTTRKMDTGEEFRTNASHKADGVGPQPDGKNKGAKKKKAAKRPDFY